MPRTYQYSPLYPQQEMSLEKEVPFEMILSGTQEAYMMIKCNDDAGSDGRRNSESNRTYKFRILPCKKDGNCLFNVLFEYLKGVKRKSPSEKSPSSHGSDGDIIRGWKKFLEILATKYGGSSGAQSSTGFYHHGIQDNSAGMGKSVDVEKGREKVCESCFSILSRQEGLQASKEIYAAMEYFDFSVTLVKQSDKSRRYFHIFHLDDEESDVFSQRSRAHILFTGDAERGHFQLLEPAEKGPYCITSMTYKVDDYNVQDKIFSLVPSKPNETEKDLFGSVVQFCKNLFKRKLPDPSDDIDEISLQKKTKRECPNPDADIQRANLNSHECTLIIQSYAEQVTKLRSEFEKAGKTSTEIFPGVFKSRVLTVQNVNTTFIRLNPKSWTEFSVSSFDTNFMIQRGGCITLRTITMGPCKIEHENEPIVQTEPFLIPQGIQYALQNDSERKTVLLRIFWQCA